MSIRFVLLNDRWLTVGVTRWWAGVDSAWEQEKLEARKMLENAADSHMSSARFVGLLISARTLLIFHRLFRLIRLRIWSTISSELRVVVSICS